MPQAEETSITVDLSEPMPASRAAMLGDLLPQMVGMEARRVYLGLRDPDEEFPRLGITTSINAAALPREAPVPALLWMELAVANEDQVSATSVAAPVRLYRDSPGEDLTTEELLALAQWAGPVLYDLAAATLRASKTSSRASEEMPIPLVPGNAELIAEPLDEGQQ